MSDRVQRQALWPKGKFFTALFRFSELKLSFVAKKTGALRRPACVTIIF